MLKYLYVSALSVTAQNLEVSICSYRIVLTLINIKSNLIKSVTFSIS